MCDICNKPELELLKEKLAEKKIKYQLEVGCQSMCAVGERFQFAIVDGQVIMKQTQKELIEEIINRIVE